MSVACLLLAAGAASRWGGEAPKSLLPWRGEPLVTHLAHVALAAGAAPVLRVLGARAEVIQATAPAPSGVMDVLNISWSDGMGASIACGLRAVLDHEPAARGILILPCDQPLVTSAVLGACFAAFGGVADRIVQCDYGEGAYGPPVVFGRAFFSELLALTGDEGGRTLIRRHLSARVLLPFPGGKWDLDSPADLARFYSAQPI